MVESIDTSRHFIASARLVVGEMDAIDDGLAVLGLAGLEERCVAASLDEIAFREKVRNRARRLTTYLPTDDERGALKGCAPPTIAGASHRSTSRTAAATRPATSNMVRAFQMVVASTAGASPRCRSVVMTACVPARLPELSNTITRSPGRSNTLILQKLAKLSTPACVRESEANTMPSIQQHRRRSRSWPSRRARAQFTMHPSTAPCACASVRPAGDRGLLPGCRAGNSSVVVPGITAVIAGCDRLYLSMNCAQLVASNSSQSPAAACPPRGGTGWRSCRRRARCSARRCPDPAPAAKIAGGRAIGDGVVHLHEVRVSACAWLR